MRRAMRTGFSEGAKMEKLKPCPFCGGEAVLEDLGGCEMSGRFFVRCSKCDIAQDNLWATKQTAIKRWNRRAGRSSDGKA